MCVPLIPLALAVGGTIAQYIGQKQAQRASNRTFNAERDRQKAFDDEQHARFKDSLSKTEGMLDPAAVARAAAKREDSLANAIVGPTAGSYLPGSASAPDVVQQAKDKSAATSAATSANLARTLAALGGTEDQLQDLNVGIGRNHESIANIARFKSGSLGVLDAEMKAAAQKGRFLRGIGGLAQQIGGAWLGASSLGGAGGAGGAAGQGVDVTYLQGAV